MTKAALQMLLGAVTIFSQSIVMAWDENARGETLGVKETIVVERKLAVDTTMAPTSEPAIVANPPFSGACGLRVLLVLDSSGSVNTVSERAAIQAGAMAFINGVEGTGSEVGILEFDTTAYEGVAYTTVTPDTKPIFEHYINNVYPVDTRGEATDWTNWDDALNKTRTLNEKALAPLIVFITDGEPTAYNNDYADDRNGSELSVNVENDPQTIWRAMEEANCIKNQGSRLLGIAVGSGISTRNLQKITGPKETSGLFDINSTDILVSNTFDELEATIQDLVFSLCAPSVTITKIFDGEAQEGIAFSGIVSGTDFVWKSPDKSIAAGDANSGMTSSEGTINFQWSNTIPGITRSMTITEHEIGFDIQMIVCSKISPSNLSPKNVSITFNSSSLDLHVGDGDIITCTVTNTGTESPSMSPSYSPSASLKPSGSPSGSPTYSPAPSASPSVQPSTSSHPSSSPSASPTVSPKPSSSPSSSPSYTFSPSASPSHLPSMSSQPTSNPSTLPTISIEPSNRPSDQPSFTIEPSGSPSNMPSVSVYPSAAPSAIPSLSPSARPSHSPTISFDPSQSPTNSPSMSIKPSNRPSDQPSFTIEPSGSPSNMPSVSVYPSAAPSAIPSLSPSARPSHSPTISLDPSQAPSAPPSLSAGPSTRPSYVPTASRTLLSMSMSLHLSSKGKGGKGGMESSRSHSVVGGRRLLRKNGGFAVDNSDAMKARDFVVAPTVRKRKDY